MDIITIDNFIMALSISIAYYIFQSILNMSPLVYISSNKYYKPYLRNNQTLVLNLIMIPAGLFFGFGFVGISAILFFNVFIIELRSLLDINKNYNFFQLRLIKIRFKLIKKYYKKSIWFFGSKLYESNYQSIPILPSTCCK